MIDKITEKVRFSNIIRPALKAENKTIALCHGVFDLVHPGHLDHFKQAKDMADILVVSITAAQYVRKGPDRPYFDDNTRMGFLSSIEYIDYVMLSEGYTVDDIIECVEPDLYVKGAEYADEEADITGQIRHERELTERHGGRIAYTGGRVFSSTKLINTGLSALPEDVRRYMQTFMKYYSMDDVEAYGNKAKELKILVVGDIIIDEYVYCTMLGLMSKNTAYSAQLNNVEDYRGGAVAIARHLSEFSDDVTLMSIMGNEDDRIDFLMDTETETLHLELLHSESYPTIVKQRYLTENEKREEYEKVFVINNIPHKWESSDPVRTEFKDKLRERIGQFDAVFLCDFGHGLIDREVMDIVQQGAKYLVLNCQTNSTNRGMNIITKYHKADVFSVDQTEIKLAFPEYADDEKEAMARLCTYLGAKGGWLTRGANGAWSIRNKIDDKQQLENAQPPDDQSVNISDCPAFTLKVKDTIGAGDAFFSVAGIYAAAGAEMELSMFMGNIAGALGANIVGNKTVVEKVNVLKFAGTLLKV